MINDYIKKVRILVSSGSEAGAVSGEQRYCNGVMTSVINFYGVIRRVDDKFIELENGRYTLYNLDTEKPIGLSYPIKIDTPILEGEKVLISINNIIAISLI